MNPLPRWLLRMLRLPESVSLEQIKKDAQPRKQSFFATVMRYFAP